MADFFRRNPDIDYKNIDIENLEKVMIHRFMNLLAKDVDFVHLGKGCSGHNCSIKTVGDLCSICKKQKL